MFETVPALTADDPDAASAASVVRPSTAYHSEVLVQAADRLHRVIGRSYRELFGVLLELDRTGAWESDGAHDLAHWVQMRYGISGWKAHRWVDAARALARLPRVARALEAGELGVDQVAELTRFATPATERGLVDWAATVSAGAIRRRADRQARRESTAAVADRERRLRWWLTDEGRRMELMAELPAADGTIVAGAIERMASEIPAMPEDERLAPIEARRADALVALCADPSSRQSETHATRPLRPRPRIVVHVPLVGNSVPGDDAPNAALTTEGIVGFVGGVLEPSVARRLACDAEIQLQVEDRHGEPLRLGRAHREPSAAIARAVRARDDSCRFPGCGNRRLGELHHVVWWSRGGPTDVENLVLVCGFHHRLVHEHGWGIRREASGLVRWIRPDGVTYRAGPSPPG